MSNTPIGPIAKRLMRGFEPSMNFPAEAQCDPRQGGCGRYNIAHPEVKRILQANGWTKERAAAVVHCTCGSPEQKAKRIADEEKLRAEYGNAPVKYGKFTYRHNDDGMGRSRW